MHSRKAKQVPGGTSPEEGSEAKALEGPSILCAISDVKEQHAKHVAGEQNGGWNKARGRATGGEKSGEKSAAKSWQKSGEESREKSGTKRKSGEQSAELIEERAEVWREDQSK